MIELRSVAGLCLLVWLSGCVETNAQSTPADAAQATEQSGQQRIAQLDGAAQDCPQTCGIEARSEVYSDCLSDGGERTDCGSRARMFYRECLESRCTEAELLLDDCKASCRVEGAADRKDCIAGSPDEAECRARSKESVQACLSDCS